MSTQSTRELSRRKRRMEYRLRGIEWAEQETPMLRGTNIHYEMSRRDRAIATGGIAAFHLLAQRVGLPRAIDRALHLFKIHKPYHESDHVLNFAYNALSGGTCIEDLELLRNNECHLDALGAQRIPDPTTAGDFCRRFAPADVDALQDAFNDVRLRVWNQQPSSFFDEPAIVEADGTHVATGGECKEGIGLSYEGNWGFNVLVVSLASTGEPLYIVNRSGNRPSHEGAASRFDAALDLLKRSNFRRVMFRGDTDFSQTTHLDRWDNAGVQFVFGYDAKEKLTECAAGLPEAAWTAVSRQPKYSIKTSARAAREHVKEEIVRAKDYLNFYLLKEDVAEFDYRPAACQKNYRIVVVRKLVSVERGQKVLYPETRYRFFITNRRDLGPADVVAFANERCNQENLNAQLKGGVRALRAPVDNLVSNWAYMVMTSLAWSMKAWYALLLPVQGRWRERHEQERRQLLRMEFRTFLNAVIRIPAQVVRSGRRILLRLMAWNRWLPSFFRLTNALRVLRG